MAAWCWRSLPAGTPKRLWSGSEALDQAAYAREDAVAVTHAPGLIGALLVGVNFAKAVYAGRFALDSGTPFAFPHR